MATQSRSNTASAAASVKLNRNERTMPKWVTEANDRVGPKPPPPPPSSNINGVKTPPPVLPPKIKNQPEPDYEIIEFSGQQYSNEPMKSTMRSKTPDSKLKCTLCGSGNPWVTCDECAQQIFCASCDDMFHKHPKRKNHIRKAIEQSRPPVPPKMLPGQSGPTPPIAPPRRGKRGFPTPLMQRKDQVNMNHVEIPASPTPSLRSNSWHDRVGSLKRGLNLMNRPLPDTPKGSTPSDGSRSTTPKSVFDTIQRPPSVTLEKIKSKACATLDRMAILQQRYRQQKEEKERNRSGSVTDQNMSFDQWSSISQSPSHFLSGSMSSGINSSHFDLTDDSNFHLFNQRQHQGPQQPQRNGNLGTRAMSTFNLNQINRRPSESHNNAWAGNQMQQAQSMAQLNCVNCSHHNQPQPNWNQHQQRQQQPVHPDQWGNQFGSHQQLNRSNLSLNVGAGYMMPPHQAHHHGMYPPPVFMNQHGAMTNMYPYPYPGGMPVMNPGLMGMPPAMRSRATSKAGSRVASPTMSRKSMTLRRKRTSYAEDEPTDDEDSDQDDRRSMVSQRSGMTSASRTRQRRMSSTSQGLLDDENEINNRNQRNKVRDQRRGSVAKSVENGWLPGRRASSNMRSSESSFGSPLKPSRIYSDLDSEGSGTRALVQAKIQQKLEEETNQKNARNQAKNKRKTESESDSLEEEEEEVQVKPMKRSMEVQAGAVRHVNKKTENEQNKKLVQNEIEKNETVAEEEQEEKDNSVHNPEIQTEDHIDDKEESPGLGPPPSTPEHEWECEFCTFVNEPKIKICMICCKTPSKPPVKPSAKPTSTGKVVPTTAKSPEPPTTRPTVKKNSSNDTHSTASITNGISKLRVTSSENESDTSMAKKKESLEDIWATLDENIQATADEVKRNAETKKNQNKKVSTSCSTSPMREIIERPKPIQKVAKEIGTSPPPQSISTQTYDTLPIRKLESNEPESMRIDSGNRIYSNESVQSQQYKPLDPLFIDHQTNEHETLVSMDRQPPYYREMSQHHERERYRSANDLHYGDHSSHMEFSPLTGLSTRQSSISELLYLQKAQPQMHSFPTDLPHYEPKPSRDPETELYILLKEAEMYKFTPEELHAALKYCGPDMHPIQWLRENWPKLIQTVQSLATKYGQERVENTIGTISQVEARDALRLHGGNIWQGVSECIEQRQRKFREISSKGNFLREDIVTALTAHQGNLDLALMDLGKTQLKPFLMRIWGSPGGVENESGATMMLPPSSASPTLSNHTMKSEIHEFLSANASECLQIPNAAGAFIKDTPPQIHENPSNYYHSNHMSDNASSYSVDSKEHDTSSPFQFDDSSFNNKGMLKDLENLIGNMEQNQAKQNEQVLRSIEGMLENLIGKRDNINETDPEQKRILTKSPITTPKSKVSPSKENNNQSPSDVKNFVWQHIQEIVPNLVQQVEMELMEEDDTNEKGEDEDDEEEEEEEEVDEIQEIELPKVEGKPTAPEPPPVDPEEFIMEEVIKPNIKEASIREDMPPEFIYAAEIANFRMEFDRCLQRDHVPEYTPFSFVNALKSVFKSFLAPKKEAPQIEEKMNVSGPQNEDNLPSSSRASQGDPVNSGSVEPENVNTTEEMNSAFNTQNEDNLQSTSSASNGDVVNNVSFESEITTLPEIKTQNENSPIEKDNAENITEKMDLQSEVANTEDIILETLIEPSAISEDQQSAETNGSHSLELEAFTNADLPIRNQEEVLPAESSQNSNETEAKKDLITNTQTNVKNSNNKTKKSRIPIRRTFSSNNIHNDHKTKLFINVANHENGETSNSIDQTQETVSETLPDNNHSQNEVNHDLIISNTSENQTLIETVSQLEEVLVTITETNSTEFSSPNTSAEPSSNEPNDEASNSLDNQSPVPEVLHSETQNSVNTVESNDSKYDIFQDLDEFSSEEEGKRTNLLINDTNSVQTNLVTTDGGEETSEGELYSIDSDHSITEDISQGETLNSGSEMLLVLGTDQQSVEILPSASGVTINSISSQSTRSKTNKEFIHSSDPSKQNLSELVSDTQRLIKQMKEEINMDEFESSDEEFTDEYSDDYDDEDEYEEEGEEEEETGDDLTELDELTENEDEDHSQRTENDDEHSIERNELPIDGDGNQEELNTDNGEQASNLNESESQNHQTAHEDHSNDDHPSNSEQILFNNSSSFKSDIPPNQSHSESHENNTTSSSLATAESSIHNSEAITETHTPFQINIEHITNAPEAFLSSTSEELNNLIDSILPLTTEVESENGLPELPLEVVLVNQVSPAENPNPLMATIGIETENSLPELPVETILINQAHAEAIESRRIINEVELENRLPEPPVEFILNQQLEQNPLTVQQIKQAENHVAELPVEVLLENQTIPPTDQKRTTINIVLNTPANEPSKKPENTTNSQTTSNDKAQPRSAETSNIPNEEASSSKTNSKIPTSHNQPSTTNTSLSSEQIEKPSTSTKKTKPTDEPKVNTQNTKRITSKIPKPKDGTPTKFQPPGKTTMRSKSFSGPTPIGISSVKAIQQEYLSKQSQLAATIVPTKPTQPKIRKNSITEAISKLTKPVPIPPLNGHTDGPSTSNGIRSKIHHSRIPKKKYHETCFSDDGYEQTSEEEVEDREPQRLLRKQSVPVFRTYSDIMQETETVNPELLVRKFMEENLVSNRAEAQIAATLVNMKFQQDVSLWAAKECSDLDQAISFLQQECELCMGTFAMNQIVSMLKCTHKCCKQCAKTYFTVQITDRSINDCNCPFCKLPELHGQNEQEDEHLEYFSNLDIFLKNILDSEVHELFQRKLRDRTLLQDPNFKWCIQCSSGFFARPKQKRLICPDCGSVTCSQCRKTWEKQHEGISCEKFLEWQEANDPEVQAQGVQEHLALHGIDCPKCKFRYSLARGGCMHFTCTQCKFEFCYGCAKPFMMGAKCTISSYCSKLGLHAHHPRNCLFYLRDKLPLQLQFLLKQNGVTFDVEPIDDGREGGSKTPLYCPVPLQKDTPAGGLVDTICKSEVPDNHAGMCRTHYVEYLTAKVAKARIDPLPIFDLTDCVQELRRRGIALPERGPWDTDEIYKNMCTEIIKSNIPLESD